MRVRVTGATGFVGRPLCLRLRRDGHEVVAVSRRPDAARRCLDPDISVFPLGEGGSGLEAALDGVEAVVNLVGESIAGGRWTRTRKERIRDSRVGLTRALVEAMRCRERPPAVLVSGSAVGVYGDRGDEELTEDSAPGTGFLAEVGVAWEREAQRAEALGVRVVCVRTGVVLGRDGGALPVMSLPFRLGVGGPLAGGRPWMPWVHLDDIVEVFARAVTDEGLSGPVLGTAPAAVQNSAFSRSLGRALGRPALLPTPGFVLRVVLGEASALALDSLRCRPQRLLDAGFSWRFATLDAALSDLASPLAAAQQPPTAEVPEAVSDQRLHLASRLEVDSSSAEVLAYLQRSGSLGALAPADLPLSAQGERRLGGSLSGTGPRGDWTATVAALGPEDIVDAGVAGSWVHAQRVRPTQGGSTIDDHLLASPSLLAFGERRRMAHFLDHRRRALRWRFGEPPEAP